MRNRKANSKNSLQQTELYSDVKDKFIHLPSPPLNLLHDILTKIQRDGNLGEVEFALERTDEIIKKYRKSFWRYRILRPGPIMLVKAVKSQFEKQPTITPLLKGFVYDDSELEVSKIIYKISLTLFFLSVLALVVSFIALWIEKYFIFWSLVIIPIFVLSVIIQIAIFERVINETVFVPLYQRIRDALITRIQSQQELIENIHKLPEISTERALEFSKTIAFQRFSAQEQEVFKRRELEIAEHLQSLAATVAIGQATNEVEVDKIRNIGSLEHMEAELNIRDKFQEKDRLHEIAMAEIEMLSGILQEQAKILGEESLEERRIKRDIESTLNILRGWQGTIRKKGSQGTSDFAEEVEKVVKEKIKTTRK